MANKKVPIKYTSRDFNSIKNDLVDHAKRYYPNTVKDFSEASFGSLMLDTVSYVGDIMSFYLDYSVNESFLTTALERKNVLKLARQMGYKIPAKMVEKIHINDKYPEYKNIYISDINRGKAMVHDGNKWKLDKYDNISDKLLDKILNFMEEKIAR